MATRAMLLKLFKFTSSSIGKIYWEIDDFYLAFLGQCRQGMVSDKAFINGLLLKNCEMYF